MNFNPKVGVVISAMAVVISVIAFLSPTAFPSYVPAAVATAIISTCAFLNIIFNAVNGVLHLYSSSAPGPLAPKDSALITAVTKLQADDTAIDTATKTAATTIIAAAAKTASALLVGATVVGALAFGAPSIVRAAEAARPVATGPIIDPLGLNKKLSGTSMADGTAPDLFTAITDYFQQGLDEAETLSLAVPSIQDGNGHDCAVAGQTLMSVLKVHPKLISGHAAEDVEGLRITIAAFHQICDNAACQKVFSEASNAIATVGVNITVPIFPAFCAKLPAVTLVPPTAPVTAPAASPTPAPTAQ
jgi:hypothetical protein